MTLSVLLSSDDYRRRQFAETYLPSILLFNLVSKQSVWDVCWEDLAWEKILESVDSQLETLTFRENSSCEVPPKCPETSSWDNNASRERTAALAMVLR